MPGWGKGLSLEVAESHRAPRKMEMQAGTELKRGCLQRPKRDQLWEGWWGPQ